MPQFLLAIQTILAVLQMLPKLIDAMDALFPAGTPGAVKLAQAKTVITTAIGVEQQATPIIGAVWSAIEPAITAIVAAKKAAP